MIANMRWKKLAHSVIYTLAIGLIAVPLFTFLGAPKASAYNGISDNVGFFTGAAGTSTFALHDSVLPWNAGSCSFAGLGGATWNSQNMAGNWSSNYYALPNTLTNSKTLFRDFIKNKYDSGYCGDWSRIGVAFIVHTMLGHTPGPGATTNLYAPSGGFATVWDEYNARIVNNPSINMSFAYWHNPLQNSYQRGWTQAGTRDAYFYNAFGSMEEPIYTFTGANGYIYSIKLRCGNPAGDIYVPPQIVYAGPSTYAVSTADVNYEKGTGGTATMNFRLRVNDPKSCDYGQPSGGSGDTVSWRVTRPDGSVVNISTQVANCTGAITSSTAGVISGNTVTYSISFTGASLDASPPRKDTYNVRIIGLSGISNMGHIAGGALNASSILTVFEAPFARFYGNDVFVCGNGTANRFVYDNRPTGSAIRGSFAEFASIYRANNSPASSFSGLNSSAVNSGFTNALKSEWGGLSCGSGIIASELMGLGVESHSSSYVIPATTFTEKKTIYVNGDATISGPISITPPGGDFDPQTYPVVLIYATGNVNIAPNVTQIEAVIVAGGTIDTCAGVAQANLETQCNNKLEIVGAVQANTIKFKRAYGSRYLANVNVYDNSRTAEVITYPWYLSFVNFAMSDSSAGKYNAYYALPPRL